MRPENKKSDLCIAEVGKNTFLTWTFSGLLPRTNRNISTRLVRRKKTLSCRKSAALYVTPRNVLPPYAFPIARRKCPTAVFQPPYPAPAVLLVVMRRDIRGQKQAEVVACNSFNLHGLLQKCHSFPTWISAFFMVPDAVNFGSPERCSSLCVATVEIFPPHGDYLS